MRVGVGIIAAALAATSILAHPGLHHDIEELSERIVRDPSSVELYLERANRYRLDGRPDVALSDLDRAAAIAAGDPRIAAERGLSFADLGCDDEAEMELTRFLASGRASTAALAARARLRARAGRDDDAIDDLDAAIALGPDPDLYLERNALLRRLGRLEDASRGLREGLARLSGAASLRLALLDVEVSAGHWTAALALADEALARAAVKTHAYLLRANILRAAGRERDARADLERALVEADRDVNRRPTGLALHARAQVLLALGRTDEARRDLRSALTQSPRFTEARELLASIPASARPGELRP
jgi:tetratricopeptide (TPR) repeat protein